MGRPVIIGVSLKMYFGLSRAREWCAAVGAIVNRSVAVRNGSVEAFVIPSFVALTEARSAVQGTGLGLGAQDIFWADGGAFTGEIGGPELVEAGCTYVEVGHAERRRLFGESERIVSWKTAATLRNGMTPVLCVGEPELVSTKLATEVVAKQVDEALRNADAGRVIVAYEPVWAIGAARPADAEHIRFVCRALRARLDEITGREGSAVIYGGSAGPGLLAQLDRDVDGLFLGRFAHDPDAFASVLREAETIAAQRASRGATV